MKKLVLHVKRLFRKYWLYILFMFAMSPIVGLANLIIMIVISLLFFRDPLEPIDEEAILQEFTDEELAIINEVEIDEKVTDEQFLALFARFQRFICPRRIDSATIWNGSELTEDAYIYQCELNDHYRWLNKSFEEGLKRRILSEIDMKDIWVQRLIRLNRNLIYRYWRRHAGGYTEIVITPEELQENEH